METTEQLQTQDTSANIDAVPDFPRFTGTIAELCDAWEADLPWSFKFMAIMTRVGLMLSGRVSLAGSSANLEPRFYTELIGKPWSGKGATCALSAFVNSAAPEYSYYQFDTPESAAALVDVFVDEIQPTFPTQDDCCARRGLLYADEASDIFDKGSSTNNGSKNPLITKLLGLYESHELWNRARVNAVRKGDPSVKGCNDALLAALMGTQPTTHEMMWCGSRGAAAGLQSRFVQVVAPENFVLPAERRPSDEKAIAEILARLGMQLRNALVLLGFTDEARQMLNDWWNSSSHRLERSGERGPDMVKRFSIVLAVTNGKTEVDADIMRQCLLFGDYQMTVREMYNPDDSYTFVQDQQNRILKVMERKKCPLSKKKLADFTNARRSKGGLAVFNVAFKNLLDGGRDGGQIEESTEKTRKGKPKYVVAEAENE